MYLSRELLKDKRKKETEFQVYLFERCNLRCAFCWQDHTETITHKNFLGHADIINEYISKDTRSDFIFNIMGGELFADDVFDQEMFDAYVAFVERINNHLKSLNKRGKFVFVTNLVFTNELYRPFYEKIQSMDLWSEFMCSYDPVGRFNKEQKELFFNNLEKYRDILVNISVVMVRPNIKAILAGEEGFVRINNSGIPVFLDYYFPNDQAHVMMPSDDDLMALFTYVYENYPEIQPMKSWMDNEFNDVSFQDSWIVHEDCQVTKDEVLIPHAYYRHLYKKPKEGAIYELEEKFLQKLGCLQCEYFNRCQLYGFNHSNFMDGVEVKTCLFVRYFDFLKSKNRI